MSTTPSAITPSSSVFDQIGSALSEPVTPEPSQAEATPQAEPTTDTPELSAPEPDATSDVSADATADSDQSQQQEEPNPYEQPEGEIPQQTLNDILKSPRGREIYQGFKAFKEFAKPFDQGGLGFVPTVDQVREHLVSHRGRMLMEADLNSGNPQQVEKVIGHILDPGRGEGGQVFASRIGPALIRMAQEASATNPQLASAYTQAYTAAAQPFLSTYNNALWDRWQEMPDGQPGSDQARAKAALGYAAQVLENDLTGKYRDVSGNAQAQGPAQDPLAQQRAELEAREANLTAFQQQQQAEMHQRITQGVNSQIDSTLKGELDKALAPLKKMYEATPRKYAKSLEEFSGMVMSEVPKNQYAWEIFQTQYREAVRTRDPQRIQALSREYMKLATPVVTRLRKQYLEDEGAIVQKQNDAQHASLRSTASHGTPNGNGVARNPVPNTPLARKPGEQQSDFIRRQLQQT